MYYAKSIFVFRMYFSKSSSEILIQSHSAPYHSLPGNSWLWEYFFATPVLPYGIAEMWFQPKLTTRPSPPPLWALFHAIEGVVPNLQACQFSPWHALLTLIPYFLSGNGPVLWLYRQSTVKSVGMQHQDVPQMLTVSVRP